jgi:flagellar biogenesis protein FliO
LKKLASWVSLHALLINEPMSARAEAIFDLIAILLAVAVFLVLAWAVWLWHRIESHIKAPHSAFRKIDNQQS